MRELEADDSPVRMEDGVEEVIVITSVSTPCRRRAHIRPNRATALWRVRWLRVCSSAMSRTPQGIRVGSLDPEQAGALLETLRTRFEENMARHEGIRWADVQAKLASAPEKLWSLGQMERTGGEPDVVGHDRKANEYVFFDCSKQSPTGRRSVCYDQEALEARKKHKPEDSAVRMATGMGAELLTEAEYRKLQEFGEYDTKTSSWLRTPPDIRELGGAIFGDFRYGTVFVYHNGAESYYAARGFRCSLRV